MTSDKLGVRGCLLAALLTLGVPPLPVVAQEITVEKMIEFDRKFQRGSLVDVRYFNEGDYFSGVSAGKSIVRFPASNPSNTSQYRWTDFKDGSVKIGELQCAEISARVGGLSRRGNIASNSTAIAITSSGRDVGDTSCLTASVVDSLTLQMESVVPKIASNSEWHEPAYDYVQISRDGTSAFARSTYGRAAVLWDVSSGRALLLVRGSSEYHLPNAEIIDGYGTVSKTSFSESGDYVAFTASVKGSSSSRETLVFQLSTKTILKLDYVNERRRDEVSYAISSKHSVVAHVGADQAASGNKIRTIVISEMESGRTRGAAHKLASNVKPVDLVTSPDGDYFAVLSINSSFKKRQSTLTILSADTGNVVATQNLGVEPRRYLQWSEDDQIVVFSSVGAELLRVSL